MQIVSGKTTKRPRSPEDDSEIPQYDPEEDEFRPQIDEPEYLDDQSAIDSDVASSISDVESESGDNEEPQPHEKCETFPNAGSSVGATSKQIADEKNRPWDPFDSEKDFQIARWFIQSGTSRYDINEFFAMGLQGTDCSFSSAYSMLKQVDQMNSGLGWESWKSGKVDFGTKQTNYGLVEDDLEIRVAPPPTSFYYRDPVACAAYLLG
jgi:hypothetical protein